MRTFWELEVGGWELTVFRYSALFTSAQFTTFHHAVM